MESTKGKLTSRDFWRGLFMAVATPSLTILQQVIPQWTESLASLFHGSMTAAVIAQAALGALVAYLLKNITTDDTKAAVKVIEKQGGTVQDASGNAVTAKKPTYIDM